MTACIASPTRKNSLKISEPPAVVDQVQDQARAFRLYWAAPSLGVRVRNRPRGPCLAGCGDNRTSV